MNLDLITPLILTYNEEKNIGRTLDCLKEFSRILVIDSFSDDRTLKIMEQYRNVSIFQRKFDTHTEQWNYGLEQAETEWVFALDADYEVPDEFIREIKELTPSEECKGYENSFKYVIHGKKLIGCLYPSRICLFRKKYAKYYQDGHTQRIQIEGHVSKISSYILHHDRKTMKRWIDNQIQYSEREVVHLLSKNPQELRLVDRFRKKLVVMPLLVVPYCLIFKGVAFNGVAGWKYALERALAEIIISLMLMEKYLENYENNRN